MVCPHASQNFAASSLRTPHRVQNGPRSSAPAAAVRYAAESFITGIVSPAA